MTTRMSGIRHWAAAFVIAVVVCSLASPAEAENGDVIILDEVVVSAERHKRNLMRVPLSITALSDLELDASAIENTFDLQYRVPGFIFKTNSVLSQPYIRGIGNDLLSVGADPAVATFVDGVYQARSVAGFQHLFDVERVEILKGPQGTLYGRNATGGAVHIISKPPTAAFEAEADALYGNFDKLRLQSVTNVPLIDKRLLVRLSGLVNVRDGYTDDIFLDTGLDDEQNWAFRGQMLLFAADNIELLVGGDVARQDDARAAGPQPDPDCCVNLGILFGGTVPDNPREVTHNRDSEQEVNAWGLRAQLTWDLGALSLVGPVTLTSLTAYRTTNFDLTLDLDGTEVDAAVNVMDEASRTFTQEVQLASSTGGTFEWIAGFYLLHEDASQDADFRLPLLAVSNHPEGEVDTDARAVFGNASYALTKHWRLTAGIRYSVETKHFTFRQTISDPLGLATGTPGAVTLTDKDKETWDAVTPKFGIAYIADNLLVYASATRGFKSGGFNTAQFQDPFDPEFIWAYELGVKTALFDRRARLAIAGFYYDYDDIQLLVIPAGGVAGTFPIVINAAQATIKGIDIALSAHPFAGFAADLSMLFLDAKFDDFVAIDPNNPDADPDRSGKRLPQAPEFSTFVGAQYTLSLRPHGAVTLRGEYRYQSATFFNPFQDATGKQSGYGLINARLQFDSADHHWYAAAFGRNLTDELYAQNIIRADPTFGSIRFWGPPRTYGVQVGYRF